MELFETEVTSEVKMRDLTRVARLRLRPLLAEVSIPLYTRGYGRDDFEERMEVARKLSRITQRQVALELYKLVTGNDAPKGFKDWEIFDHDELHKARVDRANAEALASWHHLTAQRALTAIAVVFGESAADVIRRDVGSPPKKLGYRDSDQAPEKQS